MSVRRPTPADAEAVAELCAAYDASFGAPPDVTADDLRQEWREVDLEQDAWLFELDGRVAAFGCLYGPPERLSADGYVHPDFRDRGLGTEILRLAEERARGRGVGELGSATLHADTAGRALFEANGYAFRRAFLRMGIELEDDVPEPRVPDGLVLEPFRPEDERAVHAALQEAFAEHWGNVPETFEHWRARRVEGQDTSLWLVVRDGVEIAAAAVNQPQRFGGGWVAALGTREAWRRRGLAEALLLASFRAFRERGETLVQLGVDSENPTGAVQLYERAGMRQVWRADVYRKHL